MGIPLGILSLVVVGGILAILLTSPPAPESEPVAVRDIPDDWPAPAPEDTLGEPILLEPDELESEEERIAVPDAEERVAVLEELEPDFMPLSPFTSSGTLAFSGRGRDLGRETYELTVGPEGVELRSEGYFSVRVVLANVRARFTQETIMDADLRANSYSLKVSSPLGMSFATSAHLDGQRAVIKSGDEQREAQVAPGPALFMGMFSSYALLPALVAGHPDGAVEYPILMFGRSSSGETEPTETLPLIRVEHRGQQRIATGARELNVDLYIVSGDMGTALLFARDREFLGLHMGEGEESIRVHRADYFPDGFRLAP